MYSEQTFKSTNASTYLSQKRQDKSENRLTEISSKSTKDKSSGRILSKKNVKPSSVAFSKSAGTMSQISKLTTQVTQSSTVTGKSRSRRKKPKNSTQKAFTSDEFDFSFG